MVYCHMPYPAQGSIGKAALYYTQRYRSVVQLNDEFLLPQRGCVQLRLSVCLSVNRLTQKLLTKSSRKFMEWLNIIIHAGTSGLDFK